MAILERSLWLYVLYFALVLSVGSILVMVGVPIWLLVDLWRQRRAARLKRARITSRQPTPK